MACVQIGECIKGRLYRFHGRNFNLGVYDGEGGFVGIRMKWSERYLAVELHHDLGGSVRDALDASIDCEAPPMCSLGSKDEVTGRAVAFDEPVAQGGRGWYFVDTGEASADIRPMSTHNASLWAFLVAQEEAET